MRAARRNGASGCLTGPVGIRRKACTGLPFAQTNLSGTFSVNQWNNNQWSAGVNGSGTVAAQSVNFNGGAAGTYNGNSLSGTGAGVATGQ